MKEENILKILKNKKIIIDFLGQKDNERILDALKKNKKLIEELEKIPDCFWKDAKKTGLLLYSELTPYTKNNQEEVIIHKYQQFYNKEGNYPTLVYQKKRHPKGPIFYK